MYVVWCAMDDGTRGTSPRRARGTMGTQEEGKRTREETWWERRDPRWTRQMRAWDSLSSNACLHSTWVWVCFYHSKARAGVFPTHETTKQARNGTRDASLCPCNFDVGSFHHDIAMTRCHHHGKLRLRIRALASSIHASHHDVPCHANGSIPRSPPRPSLCVSCCGVVPPPPTRTHTTRGEYKVQPTVAVERLHPPSPHVERCIMLRTSTLRATYRAFVAAGLTAGAAGGLWCGWRAAKGGNQG